MRHDDSLLFLHGALMFTRLRTIIGVRLLPLTAALLLSACAVHRQEARPDAAPSPATGEEPALPHVELPPIDVPIPEVTIPESDTAEPAITRRALPSRSSIRRKDSR